MHFLVEKVVKFDHNKLESNHLNGLLPSQATFDVNVLGPISLTRLLLPNMLKRGRGHFVVVCSCCYDARNASADHFYNAFTDNFLIKF